VNDILVSGRAIPVKSFVHRSPSLSFNRGLRTETRAVALHWTGGEGGGEQVYRVLRERGLSVQFFIDQEGHIWQYADASVRCAHIGTANGYTIGIEIANRANGKPHPKWPREAYEERVHGKSFQCSAFYPAQVAAATELTQTLCRAYGLPYETPASDTELSAAELKTVRGVLAHFHVTRRKVDCGTRLLREMGLRKPDPV
jgi:N-acetyl-anhydromuramyl-L-alanine amidase AmpD